MGWRVYRCSDCERIFAVPADEPQHMDPQPEAGKCFPAFLSCPWCDGHCDPVGTQAGETLDPVLAQNLTNIRREAQGRIQRATRTARAANEVLRHRRGLPPTSPPPVQREPD